MYRAKNGLTLISKLSQEAYEIPSTDDFDQAGRVCRKFKSHEPLRIETGSWFIEEQQ